MKFDSRTHTCGELREEQVGQSVVLNGWVDSRRDLGGLIFIYLRDRYGMTQIVFEPTLNQRASEKGKLLRNEFVISVKGKVQKRQEGAENLNVSTGKVEVIVEDIVILNEAETTPFVIKDEIDVSEELRLKYRYLDLRRPRMQNNLTLRHKITQITRNYFDKYNFLEVETPYLMKSTPEGARDFLVPSRIHKGNFYALPQSPQTYKQLLMVSGFDRYFQIVKCFRDEDLRADRQPEFTQIDVEMSFVDQKEIFEMVEGLMKELFKEIKGYEIETPIQKLPYAQAMEKYGSDKPDLRFDLELKTLNDVFGKSEFKVFKDTIESNGILTGLNAENGASWSRKQLDDLTDYVKNLGAGGLVWIKVEENDLKGPVVKFFDEDEKKTLVKKLNAKPGDLLLILSGKKTKILNIMGALRLEVAKKMELVKPDTTPSLLWVTDFPLLEWDQDSQRFYAMHHPFTSPKLEDMDKMESAPGEVNARAYDLVLNGNEIAGGSIRIFDTKVQAQMFKALGISDKEAEEKFGFLMSAFKYGAPPHGGVAFGLDRMVMLFAEEDSIRDVIAFPKTTSALSLMDNSPSKVDDTQLKDLHIDIRNSGK